MLARLAWPRKNERRLAWLLWLLPPANMRCVELLWQLLDGLIRAAAALFSRKFHIIFSLCTKCRKMLFWVSFWHQLPKGFSSLPTSSIQDQRHLFFMPLSTSLVSSPGFIKLQSVTSYVSRCQCGKHIRSVWETQNTFARRVTAESVSIWLAKTQG